MAMKDCMSCKHCVLKKMAYEDGLTNTCKFEDKISKLSLDELAYRIKTKTCDWFEKGEPSYSDEICYDD